MVATVITVLQLLQHIVSLKLGAFVANCNLVPVSRPHYSVYPSRFPERVPVELDDDAAQELTAEKGETNTTFSSMSYHVVQNIF